MPAFEGPTHKSLHTTSVKMVWLSVISAKTTPRLHAGTQLFESSLRKGTLKSTNRPFNYYEEPCCLHHWISVHSVRQCILSEGKFFNDSLMWIDVGIFGTSRHFMQIVAPPTRMRKLPKYIAKITETSIKRTFFEKIRGCNCAVRSSL